MDKRRRFLIKTFILIAAVAILITPAFAQGSRRGTPTKYVVRLETIKLSTNGTDYITIFNGTSSALDIASVSGSNQFVGDFVSGLTSPDGIYTSLKVQPDRTFTIKGSVAGYSTNGTTGRATLPYCGSNIGGTPVDCTLTVDSVDEQIFSLNPPLVVKDGVVNHKIRVYFAVTNAMATDDEETGYLYPVEPVCTVSVE